MDNVEWASLLRVHFNEKFMFHVFVITYKISYNLSTKLLFNRPLLKLRKKKVSGNFFNIVYGFWGICLKHVLKYANNLISYKVNFHVKFLQFNNKKTTKIKLPKNKHCRLSISLATKKSWKIFFSPRDIFVMRAKAFLLQTHIRKKEIKKKNLRKIKIHATYRWAREICDDKKRKKWDILFVMKFIIMDTCVIILYIFVTSISPKIYLVRSHSINITFDKRYEKIHDEVNF